MTYLVIFNGQHYTEEKIRAKNWSEFIQLLERLVIHYQQPPDVIYLIDGR